MKRKIVRQGNGGLTVSLPISWARERKLIPGDEVELRREDSRLAISATGSAKKTKVLKFKRYNKSLLRTLLSSYYRMGYSELQLSFDDSVPIALLAEIVPSLLGYEIISFEAKSCLIRNTHEPGQESAAEAINKLFHTTIFMCERYSGGANKIASSELEVLRNRALMLRDLALKRVREEASEESYEWYAFIVLLEKVTGEVYYLMKWFCQTGQQMSAETLSHHNYVIGLLVAMHKIFLNRKLDAAMSLHQAIQKKQSLNRSEGDCNIADQYSLYLNRMFYYIYGMSARLVSCISTVDYGH